MKIFAMLRKKIRSKCGETLTETLSSLLIIVPAMVMLAGAIVTAARINFEARNSKATALPELTETTGTSGTITGTGDVTFSGGTINWCNETDAEGNKSIYYYFR